ncbi:hypothetical protein LUZ61_010234 [Rhynchospora tenuis]|uniref:protein-serine/threonine phosphatase n=1 Tax=Rhynchospora tenuis TaxID=198213 RepID=A0AAD5ZZ36_9POAL|nr:hypothetical protein LUZ61_010234 [Rhynchospora tenuis]
MFKSLVYIANSPVGEVEVYPKNTNLITPVREIRISHLTQPSDRCPPLAVLHTVGSGGVCFLMECKDESAPLFSMHTACLRENKTAVIPIGEEEIHLVAMNSRKDLMTGTAKSACFWGFKVGGGLYDTGLTMLNTRCLGIVFDLDETLIVANTTRSFEDRIESLQRKISNESDAHRISGMIAEIKRYQEDRSILKQYAEGDQVTDNGKVYKVQSEVVPRLSDVYPLMTRPIIRLPEKGIVLTRINPSVRDTSVLVKMRPGWEELRSYLTARGRKRFEVYVCTMAERDYALEMWRLLDPDFNLISSSLLLDRIVCVKAGTKKSLQGVFQDGTCHPKMALVIDDRLKVWDEKDQCRVHVVPAFAPYYAPQAEANSTPPVLHVARNVACSVRGSFFKEFDDGLLPQIGAVFYEDDFSGFPSAPDAGNYLISEDENVTANKNKDPLGFDGMADAEVERRLKEATTGVQPINSKPTTTFDPRLVLPNQYTTMPHPPMGAPIAVPQPLVPLTTPQIPPPPVPFPVPLTQTVIPEASTAQTSQAREEGEVPESELDPDTRRRLLILQHGQDTRDATPPFPVGSTAPAVPVPPVSVPVPPVPMQSINRGPLGPAQYSMEPDRRPPYPPFPSDRVNGQNQRFPPPQVPRGDDRVRQNNAPPNHRRSTGWDQPPSNKETAVGALKNIAMKCGSKVEFRPVLCDTADLLFCIEVWFVGEKIGEGTGRTRKEAQYQAAEISLKNLANKYISGALSDLEKINKENGHVKGPNLFGYKSTTDMKEDGELPITGSSDESRYLDHRNANSKQTPTSIASLRELCTAEGYSLEFQPQWPASDGSGVVAKVEIAGKIRVKGVGESWEEAKIQAAEEALETLKSMPGQLSRKRSSPPRSLAAMSNKRSKSDFTGQLQRIPSSGR